MGIVFAVAFLGFLGLVVRDVVRRPAPVEPVGLPRLVAFADERLPLFHRWDAACRDGVESWIYETNDDVRAEADTAVRAFLAEAARDAPASTEIRIDVVEVFAPEKRMDRLKRGLHSGRFVRRGSEAARFVAADEIAEPAAADDAVIAARALDPLGSYWLAVVGRPEGHAHPSRRARLLGLLDGASDDALLALFAARGMVEYIEDREPDAPGRVAVSSFALSQIPAEVRPILRARLERSSGTTLTLLRDAVRKLGADPP